ncbi:MAG: hypothetical protein BWZ01_01229 [Deltaproteobacteria bacterium ADurb.BinA179]|nr:MAG: hypothetical protein BWZ01_01229 [Deltaproteobacteria bacterium ADurb.BinA179]
MQRIHLPNQLFHQAVQRTEVPVDLGVADIHPTGELAAFQFVGDIDGPSRLVHPDNVRQPGCGILPAVQGVGAVSEHQRCPPQDINHHLPRGLLLVIIYIHILGKLLHKQISLITQVIGIDEPLDLDTRDLGVQVRDLADDCVHLVNVSLDAGIEIPLILPKVVVDIVNELGHIAGFCDKRFPFGRAVGVIGKIAPRVPELSHKRIEAVFVALVEYGLDLLHSGVLSLPVIILRSLEVHLLVDEGIIGPDHLGSLHPCSDLARAHGYGYIGLYLQRLPRIPRGIRVGDVVPHNLDGQLRRVQRPPCNVQRSAQSRHITPLCSPSGSRLWTSFPGDHSRFRSPKKTPRAAARSPEACLSPRISTGCCIPRPFSRA